MPDRHTVLSRAVDKDGGSGVNVAYFDHATAFDKLSHRFLLVKLIAYGIEGQMFGHR